MTLLLAAALLPILFWDKGPDTAPLLLQAHIQHVMVPAENVNAWTQTAGLSVEAGDPSQFVKLPAPGVTIRMHLASATHTPWVNSNGWRFLRQPDGRFFYEVPGAAAALAAAEAFEFGANAIIHTDVAGLPKLGKMLEFLQRAGETQLPAIADIGYIDDGSPESGEFLNLMIRRNLLVTVVRQRDPKLALTVQLGTPDYPSTEAANPKLLAEKARARLTDEKRSLRVYGSEVAVGRLNGSANQARLVLLNYVAAHSPVDGLRVRVADVYHNVSASQFDVSDTKLVDVCTDSTGTEFTLPELKTFAIINLAP